MQLFVNARFLSQPISGVQRYGIEISRQIKKLNPETVFLAPHNIIHTVIASELNVKKIGNNSGHLWEQTTLPFFLFNNKMPLLNLCNTAPLLYPNNFITIHDLAFKIHPEWNSRIFSGFYNFLIPQISKKAKHVFTVSESVKEELINHLNLLPARVSVTYNGIASHLLTFHDENKKENIILAVGSFNLRKNHLQLIDGFLKSNLRESYQLYIVGNRGDIYRDQDSKINHKNIRIIENLTDKDLVSLYQKAAIVVSLSQYEGFGIPVLEGLFFNCKVLCSDIPVYRELYNNYVYFCNPWNISDISTSLENISTDNKEVASADTLLEKYNYELSAKNILMQIALTTQTIRY